MFFVNLDILQPAPIHEDASWSFKYMNIIKEFLNPRNGSIQINTAKLPFAFN